MFKTKIQTIGNGTQFRNVVVNSLCRSNIGSFLIGGAIALFGIGYTAVAAFKNGAKEYDREETKTFYELGLINPTESKETDTESE